MGQNRRNERQVRRCQYGQLHEQREQKRRRHKHISKLASRLSTAERRPKYLHKLRRCETYVLQNALRRRRARPRRLHLSARRSKSLNESKLLKKRASGKPACEKQ